MTIESASRAVRSLMERASGLPRPGVGSTGARHLHLAEIARHRPVAVARLYEAHTDALAILAEADLPVPDDMIYGVWASEGGPAPLRFDTSSKVLEGVKPFCSGVGIVDRALVSAQVDDGDRSVLLDVCVRPAATISTAGRAWATHALADTATTSVEFRQHRVVGVVGEPGWYLARPGFWHGACGPAAIWAGGATGLIDEANRRIDGDPHRLAHLGAMTAAAWTLRALLAQAGDEIDQDPTDVEAAELRARSLRWTVERSVHDVIDRFGRAFGPRPEVESSGVANRIHDLALYVRQHHAERELAVLARLADERGAP